MCFVSLVYSRGVSCIKLPVETDISNSFFLASILLAEVDDRFDCQKDEDCQERWTDSVCIEMNVFGTDVRQCAPHRECGLGICQEGICVCPAGESYEKCTDKLCLECSKSDSSIMIRWIIVTSMRCLDRSHPKMICFV